MNRPAHLAHLRTDRAGRPVPYINVWGDHNDVDRLRIAYDRNVHRIGTCYVDDDTAEPNFRQRAPQRQRECVVRGLCQVCARPVAWPDRQLVISSVSVQDVMLYGERTAAVIEPWLCPDCADFATRICPALIRRRRDEDMVVASVTSPDHCQLVISEGWVSGPYEMATKRDPVAMLVKIHLFGLDIVAL